MSSPRLSESHREPHSTKRYFALEKDDVHMHETRKARSTTSFDSPRISQQTPNKRKKRPKTTAISGERLIEKYSRSPGPAYNLSSSQSYKSANKHVASPFMPKTPRFKSYETDSPGVGAYDLKGKSKKKLGYTFGLKHAEIKDTSKHAPGVGSYDIDKSAKKKIVCNFGRTKRFRMPKSYGPGPQAYQSPRINSPSAVTLGTAPRNTHEWLFRD
ncbi:hypothetical protein PCE1_001480 [Barthelona sp. PCE]